jgi:hypothetical protein
MHQMFYEIVRKPLLSHTHKVDCLIYRSMIQFVFNTTSKLLYDSKISHSHCVMCLLLSVSVCKHNGFHAITLVLVKQRQTKLFKHQLQLANFSLIEYM